MLYPSELVTVSATAPNIDAVGVKRPCLAEHGKIRNVASYGKQSVCRLDLVSIGDVQGRASTVAMPHGRVVLTDLGSC